MFGVGGVKLRMGCRVVKVHGVPVLRVLIAPVDVLEEALLLLLMGVKLGFVLPEQMQVGLILCVLLPDLLGTGRWTLSMGGMLHRRY